MSWRSRWRKSCLLRRATRRSPAYVKRKPRLVRVRVRVRVKG